MHGRLTTNGEPRQYQEDWHRPS